MQRVPPWVWWTLGVATVGGVGYLVLRPSPAAPRGELPSGVVTKDSTRAQIDPRAPVWNEQIEQRAWTTGLKEYAAMGSSRPADSVVVTLAWRIGNRIWPHWDWPANFNASQLFIASDDPGRDVWLELLDLSEDVIATADPTRVM